MSSKFVYYFGDGRADGDTGMKNLIGGKGANLAEMTKIGLPVPPGFTLSTDVCTWFYANGRKYPPELRDQVADALRRVEQSTGTKFGDATNGPNRTRVVTVAAAVNHGIALNQGPSRRSRHARWSYVHR